MTPRIGRTLPPAAAPLHLADLLAGVAGACRRDTVRRFEEDLKGYFRVRHCFAVSSGKAALVLLLQALRELSPERDEVLIPAYTCYSVPSAITRARLGVRLGDVAPDSFDWDFARLDELLANPRLLCVIPTHLFGMPADVARVREAARRHGVWVIEDAAQAMGGEDAGSKLGTGGDAGFFSLGRGKAFSTVEGGVIITDNAALGSALARHLSDLSGYGPVASLKLLLYAVALWGLIHPRVFWLPKLLPFLKLGETHFDPSFPLRRLSAFQAGLARRWQSRLEQLKMARRANADAIARYGIALPGLDGERLPDLIRFPVLLPDREAKRRLLRESGRLGLGISDGYPDSIDAIGELGLAVEPGGVRNAKDLAARMVCLPLHPQVSAGDIRTMAKLLERVTAGRGPCRIGS